ncbi:BIR repeat,Zinc finger, RING/FYVE/PHD-type,Zinc finger, RING-type [Cinara cedri]|uniref:BIR repeat,Zinc finger, RING/FYVE/PHD-type,Zinc finger, RING-type n=1 Tax=Cinara cedri TaxID=506608 RepID=A0A5E4N6L3_9HEMI|nr:BIR repeat,Zinc finger, RING/FYVE/PHD-type,Zinc finger, RING-type [Cinara cedri]
MTTNTVNRTSDFWILLNSKYPLTLLEINDAIDNASSDEESTDNDGMYKNRLASYKQGWPLDFLTPQQMAKAGFYYLRYTDNVRCKHCNLIFSNWIHSDDPIRRHKDLSPRCRFFYGFFDEDIGYKLQIIDYISYTYKRTPHLNQMPNLNDTLRILLDKNIFKIMNGNSDMDFVHYEVRLDSFQSLIFQLKQSTQSLAEAGFYYIGNGFTDKVHCFSCSIGLDRWNDNDDPWEQHALNSPECDYLLLKKGDHFVKKVWKLLNATIPVCNPTGSIPMENDHEGDSSLEDGIASSTEGELVDLEENDDNNGKISLFRENLHLYQERDVNTLPDFMICKLCYRKEINVCIVPCGHAFACVNCVFAIESCVMCSKPILCVMNVSIYLNENKRENNLIQMPRCSLKNLNELTQFSIGSPKDSDDIVQLPSGLKNDSDNVAQFPSGSQKDSDDVVQLPSSLQTDSDNVVQFPNGSPKDSDDVAQLPSGLKNDSDNVAQFPSGSQKDSDDVVQLPSSLQTDSDNVVQFPNGSPKDSDDVAQLPSGLKNDSDNVAQFPSGSQKDSDDVVQLPSSLQTDSDNVVQFPSGLQTDSDNVTQFPSGLQTDSDNVAQFPSGSQKDSDDVAQLPSGLQNDSDDVVQLPSGSQKDSDDVAQLPSCSSNDSHKTNSDSLSKDKSNCKCCGKKEMKAVFIPCRHIYACQECAIKLNECPACLSPICAYIKVYMS